MNDGAEGREERCEHVLSPRHATPTDHELTAAVLTPRPTQNQVHKTQAGKGTAHEGPTYPRSYWQMLVAEGETPFFFEDMYPLEG